MPTSVMPKGVEHPARVCAFIDIGTHMPTSVMPKGVEHEWELLNLDEKTFYAHLCDAERR